MNRDFQSPSTQLPELRRRLLVVAVVFVLTQLAYCFVGYFLLDKMRDTTPREADHGIVVLALLFVAVSSLTASFVVVSAVARQTAADAAQSLSKQLIIGCALSETPAIVGLVLCFLGSKLAVLVVLAGLSAAAIVGHYLRVCARLETLEHGSSL